MILSPAVNLLQNCTVDLPGGPLQIEWREEDNHVYMTGSADLVYYGSLPLWYVAPKTIVKQQLWNYELLMLTIALEKQIFILYWMFLPRIQHLLIWLNHEWVTKIGYLWDYILTIMKQWELNAIFYETKFLRIYFERYSTIECWTTPLYKYPV